MGEVVTLHIGHCGTSLADSFWRTIAEEHGK